VCVMVSGAAPAAGGGGGPSPYSWMVHEE